MLPASSVSGDKYRFCPYDKSHVILAKSFDAHLLKCRQNHGDQKMVVCLLDHTHVVPKPELHHHLTHCSKRCLMDRERQKKADVGGLKGNVVGPPIVADHFAGANREESENWDDAPAKSFPTPALFNEKVSTTLPQSYGIIPGGGYAPPKQEEPTIRKIPNAPAKAATLSHPTPNQIRPSRNQVFEFSIGNTRMPGLSANTPRSSVPTAPPGMAGVRPPGLNQGPRFSGRGISKYATKSNQAISASKARPAANFEHKGDTDGNLSKQFDDAASGVSDISSQNSLRDANVDSNLIGQEREISSSGANSVKVEKRHESVPTTDLLNITNQQLLLQQGILQHQKQQLEQLRQQHTHQQLELAKKHQLQILQLEKLQSDEKQRLAKEQEKLEQELVLKSQALSMSFGNPTSTDFSSPSSSIESTLLEQNLLTPAIEAMMKSLGGNMSFPMGVQGRDGTSKPSTAESEVETWHQGGVGSNEGIPTVDGVTDMSTSVSRMALQDSTDSDGAASSTSEPEVTKQRRKLQKKLRQIEILEQRRLLGHVLSKAEETKLNTKTAILDEWATLSTGLDV